MRLTMEQTQAVVQKLSETYKGARKRAKREMLNQVIELTGYHRDHAARLLRAYGCKLWVGHNVVVIAQKKKHTKKGRVQYGPEVVDALETLWQLMDEPCGKRLAPYLKTLVPVLENKGEITLKKEVRQKLLSMSAPTIDRKLQKKKKERLFEKKKRVWTKPGSLLKHQIPIRKFHEWDHEQPGFVEMDLVGHDGGSPKGEYSHTLVLVDIATSWTEFRAVKNKAERWVFEALTERRKRLPFALLGVDSDNGTEFINDHLSRYCTDEKITFTRSRPYRKNDGCYVEQKNFSVVRKYVGYFRYETPEQLRLLNALYDVLRLYINFFQPVMKRKREEEQDLMDKKKGKHTKRYDTPQTPYQRVLASLRVPKPHKLKLKRVFRSLNPVTIKQEIEQCQQKLLATLKKEKPTYLSAYNA